MARRTVDSVILYVGELDRAVGFYRDVVGLAQEIPRTRPRPAAAGSRPCRRRTS